MKFLVTGGAGFIGANLCARLLGEGHELCLLDILNDFYPREFKERNLEWLRTQGSGWRFVQGDICDRGLLDRLFAEGGFDQVIHLAARAGAAASLADPALCQRVNVEGTATVLDAARRAGVRKVTMASSSSVYGANTRLPFAEVDPVARPLSPYGASKLACEALGHAFHHAYGMDIALLRFFTVYGPRQRPDLVIYKFTERMLAGRPIPVYGDGTAARDYTHVSDVVEGIVACTAAAFGCEVFNLGDSRTTSLLELIRLLEAELGSKAVLEFQPAPPGDVPVTCADIGKAQRRLSYRPRVTVEQGIPRFVEWFLAERAAGASSSPSAAATVPLAAVGS